MMLEGAGLSRFISLASHRQCWFARGGGSGGKEGGDSGRFKRGDVGRRIACGAGEGDTKGVVTVPCISGLSSSSEQAQKRVFGVCEGHWVHVVVQIGHLVLPILASGNWMEEGWVCHHRCEVTMAFLTITCQ